MFSKYLKAFSRTSKKIEFMCFKALSQLSTKKKKITLNIYILLVDWMFFQLNYIHMLNSSSFLSLKKIISGLAKWNCAVVIGYHMVPQIPTTPRCHNNQYTMVPQNPKIFFSGLNIMKPSMVVPEHALYKFS